MFLFVFIFLILIKGVNGNIYLLKVLEIINKLNIFMLSIHFIEKSPKKPVLKSI